MTLPAHPSTIDNPLAWLPFDDTTVPRHLAAMAPVATRLVSDQLCNDVDLSLMLAELLAGMLAAPLDIPSGDALAAHLQTLDEEVQKLLYASGFAGDQETTRRLLLGRLQPVLVTLKRLQPLLEAADTVIDIAPAVMVPYFQTLLQRHAAEGPAKALERFLCSQTQRDLARSLQRRRPPCSTVEQGPSVAECHRGVYRELLDTVWAGAASAPPLPLRPTRWAGMLSCLLLLDALHPGTLATTLRTVINPAPQ